MSCLSQWDIGIGQLNILIWHLPTKYSHDTIYNTTSSIYHKKDLDIPEIPNLMTLQSYKSTMNNRITISPSP
jgi:hypothetical protein